MEDLKRQVEAQFWAAYARRIWEMVNVFSTEACYGCSHDKQHDTDHNVCLLGDNKRIKKFLTKADKRINREQIVADWMALLREFSPPLEDTEMLFFDETWISAQFRRKDRHETILRILCDEDDVEIGRSTGGDTIPLVASGLSENDWNETSMEEFEFNVIAEDEENDFLRSWNQMESGLAHPTSEESDEESMSESIKNVIQPTPYDEELLPDVLVEQPVPFFEEIRTQTTDKLRRNADAIEVPVEAGSSQEEEEDQHDPRDSYDITQTSQKRVAKFNTTATDYLLTVKDLRVHGLREVLNLLDAIFSSILVNITKGMLPTDQVRFVMHSPQLSYPISLPFMPLRNLTATRIMFEIERVLQSNEQFSLDGSVHVNLIHVAMPSGGKSKIKRGGINLKKRMEKKRCFIQIRNKDELCLARAIVTAIARLDKDRRWSSFRQGAAIQRTEALKLHNRAGVPLACCGLEEVKKFQAVLAGYQIVVVSAECFNRIVYKGPDTEKVIYLYLHDGHFDIITSMAAFLNRAYFCVKCCKGYDVEDGRHHKCDKCCCCHKSGCPDVDQWCYCNDCARYFKGATCFSNHKHKTGAAKSVCETYVKCTKCNKVIDRTQRNPADHKCGEVHCSICKIFVNPELHRCYMQPLKRKAPGNEEEKRPKKKRKAEKNEEKKKAKAKYLFFDFECIQETGTHVPNLVVVQDEEGNEHVFSGPDTRDEFCDWLFSGDLSGAVCIAHNLKGYDSYFILQYLYENKILPDLILNGAKVMMIEESEEKIRFIDSLNFLVMPLSDLPKAFGLRELSKGFFPHLFNTQANQRYVGEIPDAKYYDPDGMKPETRAKFLLWHEEQRKKAVVFDMQKEMLSYCRSDVHILRRCCLKFRSLIMDLCKIDPFEQCITIASVCNTIFRTSFLKKETIAIIPSEGYRPKWKQSIMAYKWLAYESHKRGIRIQHGRNGGEKRVGPYSLDGYHAESNTAFELDGCYYHGHNLCYPGHVTNPMNGLTMKELYEKTMERRKYLEAEGKHLVQIWECEFKRQLKEDADMAAYIKGLKFEDEEPLNPRDAFYGGRVNATKLLVNAEEDEKIKYVDFTSLYPWVNKYGVYPLGHPRVLWIDQVCYLASPWLVPPSTAIQRERQTIVFPLPHVCLNHPTDSLSSHRWRARLDRDVGLFGDRVSPEDGLSSGESEWSLALWRENRWFVQRLCGHVFET